MVVCVVGGTGRDHEHEQRHETEMRAAYYVHVSIRKIGPGHGGDDMVEHARTRGVEG
jgi:hypothetical protein